MKEKISTFIAKNIENPAFGLQYIQENEKPEFSNLPKDPLHEDRYEVCKGLIHKYKSRVLLKVSDHCAAHCRFCTRIRHTGTDTHEIRAGDFALIKNYLLEHPEVSEIIFSGGDPFFRPAVSRKIWELVLDVPNLQVFRIGTRLPFQQPDMFYTNRTEMRAFLELIEKTQKQKAVYILLHIEHPDELKPESIKAMQILRSLGVNLLSQTVFLKGINNRSDILAELFSRLIRHSVIPYYIYSCDKAAGLERFICAPKQEKLIMRELRQTLSGLALPLHVRDTEKGKIPVY